MSSKTKKGGGRAAVAEPQRERLRAVRRLAEAGDLARARQRLAALSAEFPTFKPLLGLAWEVEDLAGDPITATSCAWRWHQRLPGSQSALQALADSAREAGFGAIFIQALHRLRQLETGTDADPLTDHIDAPLGRLTVAEAEALDLGRLHLAMDEPAAAAAALAGVNHPSALNNLALSHFAAGAPARAIEAAEAAWQAHPSNVFALDLLARARCWSDGLPACAPLADLARQAVPQRAEDANARVSLLRWLGDEAAARRAHAECAGAGYWREAEPRLLALFDQLADPGPDEHGTEAHWFPQPWRQRLRALAAQWQQRPSASASGWRARWDAHLLDCDAHADYLERAGVLGSATVRQLARDILLLRAQRGDVAALDQLRQLLKSAAGPDSERSRLLQQLTDSGLSGGEESVYLNGEVRRVRSHGLRLNGAPRPSPFTPAGEAMAQRMHAAVARGDMHEARREAEQLCDQEPQQAAAWANLGALLEGMKAPVQDVEAAFGKAHELAPDYLFGRCGLARVRAAQGREEEAKALLDGLLEREEWHLSEYRSYLMAQVSLARAAGDDGALREMQRALHDLADR